jgi:hypothetical protein
MQSSERYLIAVAAMDRYRYCGCNCGRYHRYLLPWLPNMVAKQPAASTSHGSSQTTQLRCENDNPKQEAEVVIVAKLKHAVKSSFDFHPRPPTPPAAIVVHPKQIQPSKKG